jgi:exopolyphosphatase/guanosine-5'-triphosphate,3'-diphosphate pyrophosphatase
MRVAAIDCGTNSVRLLLADVAGDRLTDVARRMRIVRLGEGVDRTGRLAPEAIERTRRALLDYAAEIAASGASRVRMVATSASGTRPTPRTSVPWSAACSAPIPK